MNPVLLFIAGGASALLARKKLERAAKKAKTAIRNRLGDDSDSQEQADDTNDAGVVDVSAADRSDSEDE